MSDMLCRTLGQFLGEALVVVGLVCISIGIATAMLSRRIARAVRKTNEISEKDKIYVSFKLIGLLLVVVGFALIALDIILYIIAR